MTVPNKWILLLYGLPTKKGAARVNLWRQLRGKSGLSDEELLKRGGECFDALYQQLKK